MTQFIQRLFVGSGLILITLLWIFLSNAEPFKPFLAFAYAFFIGIVLWEFYRLPIAKGCDPLDKIGVLTGAAFILSLFYAIDHPFFPFIILGLSLVWGFGYFLAMGTDPLINLSTTYFGIVYLALPLGCLVLIHNHFPDSRLWLLYAIVVTKFNDIGAYFGGKLFGKHPLTPTISPLKTYEGAISGLTISMLTSLTFSTFLNLNLLDSLILGFCIGTLAQFGDAAESLLKRDAKIKDSNSLPGLGGLLDVVDSLVFTLPFVYGYIKFMEI
ncbi:MAG: Phosphatidate cytidylyltransferase [Chlamydiae bacterium]|nr:Phosphatidate cytidylyltransferase [Chlamydiota bacterium]